ncbi:MAG TPA: hypothetical protein VD902_01980 [Symbiobacteriaceae bacterium]|nr:hypothetical protein [Symbiobacteriaceae bacterium]
MSSVWQRAIPLMLVTVFSCYLLVVPLPEDGPVKLVGNASQVAGSLVGAVYLFIAAHGFGSAEPSRRGWMLLALSMASNALGFATYGAMELAGADNPVPSAADLFWLLSYPLALSGIGVLARSYLTSGLPIPRPNRAWGATAVSLILVAVYVVLPLSQDQSSSLLERVVVAAYPVGDALVIGAAFYMAELMSSFGRGALAWPWLAIISGEMLVGMTDIAYAQLNMLDLYHTGHFVDQGWVLSGVLMALGGLLQWRIMSHEVRSGG